MWFVTDLWCDLRLTWLQLWLVKPFNTVWDSLLCCSGDCKTSKCEDSKWLYRFYVTVTPSRRWVRRDSASTHWCMLTTSPLTCQICSLLEQYPMPLTTASPLGDSSMDLDTPVGLITDHWLVYVFSLNQLIGWLVDWAEVNSETVSQPLIDS